MKKNLLLFGVFFLLCTSANAEEVKYINGVKNVYIDKEYNQEVTFICDSLHKNEYINSYARNHMSQYCIQNPENLLKQQCQNEMIKLYEKALCSSNGANSRAILVKANQILQKHSSWNNAWIWVNLDSGKNRGCYTGYIIQLVNKTKYCK